MSPVSWLWDTPLPDLPVKHDRKPLLPGADVDGYVRAADLNAIRDFLNDLRTEIIASPWSSLGIWVGSTPPALPVSYDDWVLNREGYWAWLDTSVVTGSIYLDVAPVGLSLTAPVPTATTENIHVITPSAASFGLSATAPTVSPKMVKLLKITLPSAPDSTFDITGVGFRPSAVIFFSSFVTEQDAPTGNMRHGIGVATQRGGAIQQGAYALASQNGVTTTVAKRLQSASACLLGLDNATLLAKAAFNGFSGDGCQLDVQVTPATASERLVYALFIGGTTDAEVLSFQSPVAAGDTYLGGNFTPDALLVLGAATAALDTVEDHAVESIGFASASGQANNRLMGWRSSNARADSSKAMSWSGGFVAGIVRPEGPPPDIMESAYAADLTGGIKLTWTKNDTNQKRYFALSLKGISAAVGQVALPVNTGSAPAAITGLGFKPVAILSSTPGDDTWTQAMRVFYTSPVAEGFTFGASSGPGNDLRADDYDRDGATPTNCGRRMYTSGIFHSGDFNSHHISVPVASMDASGFSFGLSVGAGPMALASLSYFLAFAYP